MAVFKCKMCGGALDVTAGTTVIECDYCGAKQTLPKLDDDRKANLYDRANHFRRNNEFDKAMGIYENILNEDNTDAEAYWSLVLCRFGIEYVEDPSTHKRVPTVNRAQFTSVFDDDNYKSALKYADSVQRGVYEEEAKAINEIQKGILAISQKEEPFDVFICYKESDANGRRTPDSVLAQDLYYQLTQEGFKVFFSRITLEDKLGSAYEPYIFAALNSSKVMVVLGTKPEHYNAVWVKNEWSRYLALIKQGQKKILIPAYKDIDPYDLPDEFSHLQAQDMSKLGFMQDLIRGIKKILQVNESKPATAVNETVKTSNVSNTAPLLKRAFMFLEDCDWNSANEYCEKVLDQDPENAQAYLGKLMVEERVNKQEQLRDCKMPFDNNKNYQKAVRFADDTLRDALTEYVTHIKIRNENARLEGIYRQATQKMAVYSEDSYKEAAKLFESIKQYKDSASLAEKCKERTEPIRKDNIYSQAKIKMQNDSVLSYEAAIQMFKSIHGWKDSAEQIEICKNSIENLRKKAEEVRKDEIYAIAKARMQARNVNTFDASINNNSEKITSYFPGIVSKVKVKPKQVVKKGDVLCVIEAMGMENDMISSFDGIVDTVNVKVGSHVSGGDVLVTVKSDSAKIDFSQPVSSQSDSANKNIISAYESAIQLFGTIYDWKDSAAQIELCKKKIEETKAEAEAARKAAEERRKEDEKRVRRAKLGQFIAILFVLATIAGAIIFCVKLYKQNNPTIDGIKYVSVEGGYAVKDYKGSATEVTILSEVNGEPVVEIGKSAFYQNVVITDITIPDSVTTIGDFAFGWCTGLTSVIIPNSVTTIGDDAFSDCTGLTSIIIPNSVIEIGDCAFSGCTRLTSVIFKDTSGWYVNRNVGASSGTAVDVSNPSTAATYLKNTYKGYNWYKK